VKGKVAEGKRNSKLFSGSTDNTCTTVTFYVESRQNDNKYNLL